MVRLLRYSAVWGKRGKWRHLFLHVTHYSADAQKQMLFDENVPMVVACVDYLRPIYEEVNQYYHLIEGENVSGNPENEDIVLLKEKAWKIVKPHLEKEKRLAKAEYFDYQYHPKTSNDLNTILKAAQEGKVSYLLLKNSENEWGEYRYPNRVINHLTRQPNSPCLHNLAALKTIENGGKVFFYNRPSMPDHNTKIAAVFRY